MLIISTLDIVMKLFSRELLMHHFFFYIKMIYFYLSDYQAGRLEISQIIWEFVGTEQISIYFSYVFIFLQ